MIDSILNVLEAITFADPRLFMAGAEILLNWATYKEDTQ